MDILLQNAIIGHYRNLLNNDMAIFSSTNDEEIERLSAENERLNKENLRLNGFVKKLENEVRDTLDQALSERKEFEVERIKFKRKLNRLEHAYHRIKKQRDGLRISNKTDPL